LLGSIILNISYTFFLFVNSRSHNYQLFLFHNNHVFFEAIAIKLLFITFNL